MDNLTVLICTYNRIDLLKKTINSLNKADRPDNKSIDILVAANACTDDTHTFLADYQQRQKNEGLLSLNWLTEPIAGKSYALNTAIPTISSSLIAFVDDDHRVDKKFFISIFNAFDENPASHIYCGRILPDWDGNEPAWLHDDGEYKIYPLPVPRYDQGNDPRQIDISGPLPGGGNVTIRKEVFSIIGLFSTQLGPHGHNLGGGEDSDFMHRAVNQKINIFYDPEIIQYHYVDTERLKLSYIIKKSFQRSRSITFIHSEHQTFPFYLFRKLVSYLIHTLTSLYWPETRFYLVRSAATLGEISAYLSGRKGS
ncbi:MAG: glycosyltransferase [Gammaproteobacteria bacterium]|nr:glycosyltransferase [Gammaproteobacteria bacterium]